MPLRPSLAFTWLSKWGFEVVHNGPAKIEHWIPYLFLGHHKYLMWLKQFLLHRMRRSYPLRSRWFKEKVLQLKGTAKTWKKYTASMKSHRHIITPLQYSTTSCDPPAATAPSHTATMTHDTREKATWTSAARAVVTSGTTKLRVFRANHIACRWCNRKCGNDACQNT